MTRTHISEISSLEGTDVRLFGWVHARRDHGKIIFIDLRDRSGLVQLVFTGGVTVSGAHPPDQLPSKSDLRLEYVIEVVGTVKKRPPEMVNEKLPNGFYEVEVKELKILSRADAMPIAVDTDGYEISEEARLKYRYLDLRRERMKNNLVLRHLVMKHIRTFLGNRGFVEIDTPILTKATPEGARDFLVPSRLQPGKFYALPQSPQQYKQLLMVAGIEKYYQIARCFRDEDPRSDRSYGEFSQLDIEMSFTTQDEILKLVEELYIGIAEEVAGKQVLEKPFPRFTHQEAMERFGADKFDLRTEKDPNILAFAWVTDFPLFEETETRALAPSHHPFTAPKDEDIPLLDADPLKVRSWQHDLVCNGIEVGGGSIRITDPEIQKKVFKILGHTEEEIQEKFGHLLEAFRYGVPPHGGIAPGIERLMMVLMNEENVREVTAFPMTSGGQTAVMDAPSAIDPAQLKELGLRLAKEKE